MNYILFIFLIVWILPPNLCEAQEADIDAKMQKMAAQLAERIRATGKSRVGVADFNDLQGNIPENSRRYGIMPVVVEGCKVKTRVINSDRLFLSKTKPN